MSLFITILIIGLFQAFILGFVIVRKKQFRLSPLLVLLAIIAAGLSLRLAFSPKFYQDWVKLVQLSDLTLFLFGPAFWFFIRSTITPLLRTDWRKHSWHLIPALIFLLHYAWRILPLSSMEFMRSEAAGHFNLYYDLLLGFGLVMNSIYWTLSAKLVLKAYKGPGKSQKFLMAVLVINGLTLMCWATGYLLGFLGPQWYDLMSTAYQYGFIALSGTSIFIAYHALSSPAFWMNTKPIKKYAKSRLSEVDLKQIGQKLKHYIEEEKAYLDHTFNLDDLSTALKVNKVQLSQVINQYLGKGFADWMNEYRVEEFIGRVESGKYRHLTYLGIATESGFNTKATFNKAFKKAKGSTPSDYFANGNQPEGEQALSSTKPA